MVVCSGPTVLMGHCATIRCISFFPDGCRLVAGTDAGSLHLWNFQSSSPSDEQWHAHSRRIHAVAVAHDGSKIASGSQDKHVNIWDPEDHTSPVMSWTCSAAVRSLSWHQDHQYLVVGLDDGKIQMINTSVNDKNLCSWISTDHLSVWCVIHSPDGTYLASAGSDGSVSVWDSMLREKIAGPFTHNGPVYSICWNDDGTQVVSASEDKTLKVWHATTGELMSTLCGHDDQVFTVTVSSHQGLLASGAGDGSVQLWEASTFRVAGSALRHESGIWCATFSPDGTWLACGSWTKPYVIYIYKISLPGSGRVVSLAPKMMQTTDLDVTVIKPICLPSQVASGIARPETSTAISFSPQPYRLSSSVLADIRNGITLSQENKLDEAMVAFDVGVIHAKGNADIICFILMAKSITIFNLGCYDAAIRLMTELINGCQHSNIHVCQYIKAYALTKRGMDAFDDGGYDAGITLFRAARDLCPTATSLQEMVFSHGVDGLGKLKKINELFGWDFNGLELKVNQRICECLTRTGKLKEAVSFFRSTKIDDVDGGSQWARAFKMECVTAAVTRAVEALAAEDYGFAIDLYSVAISLDSSQPTYFFNRSIANAGKSLWKESLQDAEEVIKLSPSSPLGYERKRAALHGLGRYDEAIEAFRKILALEGRSPNDIGDIYRSIVSPSEVERLIEQAAQSEMRNTPHRVFDVSNGMLCSRGTQMILAFKSSPEYRDLVSSISSPDQLTRESQRISAVVSKFFQFVVLSHRWQKYELAFHDVQGLSIISLPANEGTSKLQNLCRTAAALGYRWAWSDTCCINKQSSAELQEAITSMFSWYRHAALTIVYLSDVAASAGPGSLKESEWHRRGWTLQEFLASRNILFYSRNWTLYRNIQSLNHKQVPSILDELEVATSIKKESISAFSPGLKNAREKLRWASHRTTTVEEDVAYSLFGIFDLQLSVFYGEKKEKALGRLLQEIVARSGDVLVLEWTGKSSLFNSCLPDDISSFKNSPLISPSSAENAMQPSVAELTEKVNREDAIRLYNQLRELGPPRFSNSRLLLPSIIHPVQAIKEVQYDGSLYSYSIASVGLNDICFTSSEKLLNPRNRSNKSRRQKFILAQIWNRELLDQTGDQESEHRDGNDMSAMRLVSCLARPFFALLLVEDRHGEYKRVASDGEILPHTVDLTKLLSPTIKTLEIL